MTVIDQPIKDVIAIRPPAVLSWSTRLDAIDPMTGGGFQRGKVWVITGDPGVGKTALLCQFAYRLAVDHGFRVELHGHRADGIAAYRRWLLGMVRTLSPQEDPDLDDPLLRPLMSSGLVVSDAGYGIPEWRDAGVSRRALLIDDPEFKSDPVLDAEAREALRRSARAGAMVIVTSPLRHCFEAAYGPGRAQRRQEWADTADVIVEVVPGASPWIVELVMRRNRHGPCASQAMGRRHDGHLVRYAASEH